MENKPDATKDVNFFRNILFRFLALVIVLLSFVIPINIVIDEKYFNGLGAYMLLFYMFMGIASMVFFLVMDFILKKYRILFIILAVAFNLLNAYKLLFSHLE